MSLLHKLPHVVTFSTALVTIILPSIKITFQHSSYLLACNTKMKLLNYYKNIFLKHTNDSKKTNKNILCLSNADFHQKNNNALQQPMIMTSVCFLNQADIILLPAQAKL